MTTWIGAIEPIARITVATLFNSLWEAALLALAVALILRVFPNLNATTRYALWSIALVGSLVLPLATSLPQISVQHPSSPHANGSYTLPSTSHTAVSQSPVKQAPAKQAPSASAPVQNASPSFRLPERLRFSLPEYVALGIFVAWALATLAMLVRLGVNLWRLERLKSDALPLPIDYRDRLARWSSAEKGGRDVRLCTCDRIEVPVAVGLFDSMILIPQHLLETLSQEEMDQVMLHELAHLRRADDWTNGVQRVIQALFFFNPAVLFIAQQLDVEREVACDDWVVHQTREVRPYATCLTKMAEVTAWPHRPLAAPGVFVTRRGLSVRVERLLRAGRNVRTSIAFGPAGGAVAGLVVLFFILQTVAPSFAFTLPQAHSHTIALAPLHVAVETKPSPAAKAQSKTPAATQTKTQTQTETKTQIETQTKTKAKTTAPSGDQRIDIPATHVHVKGQTIRVPDVNVDVPAQHIVIKKYARYATPPLTPMAPLPPNFSKTIHDATTASVGAAMRAAAVASTFNCVGCDYSGQNLAGHSFRSQRLNGSDFSRANLQNADFSNSELTGADFSHANLRGASFANAKLTGCDLSQADLTGVNFSGAEMTGCDVSPKSLSAQQAGMLMRACRTGCDFSGANLQNQDLHGLSVAGLDLSDADLRGANLSGVNFSGVDLSHARLDGANVSGARFTGCDFSGVDLHNVDMSKATVVGTRFNR